ncbi:MAG: hypothetical protein QXU87_06765 [Candidatus Caldarchaeum sp.]|uniref:Uncharacterized protein n=1 Tax=Caldiarchaeum subterraneum TaxID=311458 RepID=A0A7C5L838_CALS0
MHEERVLLALDCWKKVFTLKTLGGGYVRCFLLFGEEGLTAVETSETANIPPWVVGSTGDVASDILSGVIAEASRQMGYGYKPYIEKTTGKTVGMMLNSLGNSVRKSWYIPYQSHLKLVVKKKGEVRVLSKAGRVQKYLVHPESLPLLNQFVMEALAGKLVLETVA